jgi:regulator of protease activity HflC (stomatin/prohibitin superfamily)
VDATQWGLLAAGVSAVGGVASAVVAAVAARQANAAAQEAHAAAQEANVAAGTMAEIERERFWRESAPVFRAPDTVDW